MLQLIERAIRAEAKKRMAAHSKAGYEAKKYRVIFHKRTGLIARPSTRAIPSNWLLHKHYDPRYCLGHSAFLAKGIWSSLQNNNYEPIFANRVEIPKDSGGVRVIDAFSIPDAAVAKILLLKLRVRNAKIFSDASYAYQEKKQPLDAVLRLSRLLDFEIVFVSQYDFSKYFDSIRHKYVNSLLADKNLFLTTNMERSFIKAVMTHRYRIAGGRERRRRLGTPQGNSVSLFVANVAAHPLDTELSRRSGAFARFADDAVVVNYNYEDALKCAEAFHSFAQKSGIEINHSKSSGIRLFTETESEIANIADFTFLSYKFTRDGLRVGEKAVARIKKRCSRSIYNHLILYLKNTGHFNPARRGIGFRDWDLVTCLNELRNYIYGGRRQAEIESYLEGEIDLKNISGAVSYFCLVSDGGLFQELDGWLVHVISRAYQERLRLIAGITGRPVAAAISTDRLLSGAWYRFPRVAMETRCPSFHLAWRASKKSWGRHGLGGVDTAGFGYGYDT